MASYTQVLDSAGNVRVDIVRADDGSLVLTGRMALGGEVIDVEISGDATATKAYQAWLAGGGKLGDPVALVRIAPGYALAKALPKGSKVDPRDIAYIGGRPTVPESSDSIARIAPIAGLTPKSWFDAALGVSA